ncbi:glucan endo-1,3-beta-glucosidase-like [Rutidosis leptorrhynchoides]|uniref:glucan endo-1,3-beta-glucosidase-like n=1 Tax=Rutidosis leptorrhynchoides TaxID=125765 RepID=UPI003A991CF5
MATISPLTFRTVLILYFVIFSGGILKPAKVQAEEGQGFWCVAKPSASEMELKQDIVFACKFVECNIINPGGACFEPQTLINHASVVMNLYYQANGRHPWDCDFTKSAIVAINDPSYGDCKYPYN